MVSRGNLFLQKVASSRRKIAKITLPFIADGAVSYVLKNYACVLTHLPHPTRYYNIQGCHKGLEAAALQWLLGDPVAGYW